jgi:hypothetical protein
MVSAMKEYFSRAWGRVLSHETQSWRAFPSVEMADSEETDEFALDDRYLAWKELRQS